MNDEVFKIFSDQYIQRNIDKERDIEVAQYRENMRTNDIDGIDPRYEYDVETFEPIDRGEISVFMIELANFIHKQLNEFEPFSIRAGRKGKLHIGVTNPVPSKRVSGEKFKSKILITIEKIKE